MCSFTTKLYIFPQLFLSDGLPLFPFILILPFDWTDMPKQNKMRGVFMLSDEKIKTFYLKQVNYSGIEPEEEWFYEAKRSFQWFQIYQDFSKLKDIISPNAKILSLASLNTNWNREKLLTREAEFSTGLKEKSSYMSWQSLLHVAWLDDALILGFYGIQSVLSASDVTLLHHTEIKSVWKSWHDVIFFCTFFNDYFFQFHIFLLNKCFFLFISSRFCQVGNQLRLEISFSSASVH